MSGKMAMLIVAMDPRHFFFHSVTEKSGMTITIKSEEVLKI